MPQLIADYGPRKRVHKLPKLKLDQLNVLLDRTGPILVVNEESTKGYPISAKIAEILIALGCAYGS